MGTNPHDDIAFNSPQCFPANEIIVVQTSEGGVNICSTALKKVGLERNLDFVTQSDTEGLEERIYPNHPQLLITSTFGGNQQMVVEMVRRFRQTNPQLVVILCTALSSGIDPTFDAHVCKEGGNFTDQLALAVQSYMNDELRHREAA